MTEPVVRCEAVEKTYRRGPEEIHALTGVAVSIKAGEVVALVGPSGSGKTTLLSVLAGWDTPDAGTIAWAGDRDAASLGWHDVAVVPQTLGLVEELSIRENVEVPLRVGDAIGVGADRIASLLEAFGLGPFADRLPPETSLGEQQRAALARALVRSPRLLMADEPTGHQDAAWTGGVLLAIEAAAAEGTAVLMATHHRALVRFADRVLAMEDGRVRQVAADQVVGAGDEL